MLDRYWFGESAAFAGKRPFACGEDRPGKSARRYGECRAQRRSAPGQPSFRRRATRQARLRRSARERMPRSCTRQGLKTTIKLRVIGRRQKARARGFRDAAEPRNARVKLRDQGLLRGVTPSSFRLRQGGLTHIVNMIGWRAPPKSRSSSTRRDYSRYRGAS